MRELIDPKEVCERAARAGLSVIDLADRAGVARSTVFCGKNGQRIWNGKTYNRIIGALREVESNLLEASG